MIRYKRYNHLFLITWFLITIIDAATSYIEYSLEDHHLCSPTVSKHKIKLELEDKSALKVELNRLKDHQLQWTINSLCKFKLAISKPSTGIIAVIQNIVFRTNEHTGKCIDYVLFTRRDGSKSKQYCGRLDAALAMDHNFAPYQYATSLAPTSNSFVDPFGQLEVSVFISKEPLEANQEMDLSIVFTSYRTCSRTPLSTDLACEQNDKDYSQFCIYEHFFNDGYVNCPFSDCVDEAGCSEHEQKNMDRKESIGSKVIIGSMTSLFIMFLIFIVCLWLCRKHGKMCWANEFSNSNVAQQGNSSQTTDIRTIEMSTPSPSRGVARVNNEESAVTDVDLDKDLPPSYNSLFPDR